MRRLFRLLPVCILLLAAFPAFAQLAAVTGTVTDAGGVGVPNAYLQFDLYGCGGNRPRWTGGVVSSSVQLYGDANGAVTGNVVRNDQITCANTVGNTTYFVQQFINGQPSGPRLQYQINAGTFNWNTQVSLTQAPVVSAPTGDTIYARLDGTNMPFTGPVTHGGHDDTGIGILGAATVNGVVDLVGKGAKCDGTTDDRATIQAVLNTAGVKVISAPPGVVCLIASNPGGGASLLTDPGVGVQGYWTIKIGNSIGTYPSLFSITGSPTNVTFKDITVDGNATNNAVNSDPIPANNGRIAFLSFAGSNLTFFNLHFINGNDVQTIDLNTCDDCSVIANTWSNYGIGGTFDHDSSEVYMHSNPGHSGLVIGNHFTAAGLGVRTAIEVHGDNMSVLDNVVQNYRQCIITAPQDAPNDHNYVIDGNTCSNAYRGVYMFAQPDGYDGLNITNNVIGINRSGFWTVSQVESAIGTDLNNVAGFKNTNISGNMIRYVPDALAVGATAGAISLASPNNSLPFPLTNVNIVNNTIDSPPCSGIYISNFSTTIGLVIRGNHITNPGTNTSGTTCFGTAFKTGITFNTAVGQTYASSVVEGNTISDNQVSPTMQVGIRFFGTSGDNTQTGLVFKGDTITYTGTPPNASASFIEVNGTCPELHEIIPNFNRNDGWMNTIVNSQFCPKGSTIYDPIVGRLYMQSVSNATTFVSSELGTVTPSTAHSIGDIVWNSVPSVNGPCGWNTVTTGTPAAFTSIPCALPGSRISLTSDFVTSSASLVNVGLGWVFPNNAANYNFHCALAYSQATAAVANSFGIQATTNAPTNIFATGQVYTAAGTATTAPLATLNTTTATNIVSFTPSATATTFVAYLDGSFELPASFISINIMALTGNVSDALTVKRGSYCQLF